MPLDARAEAERADGEPAARAEQPRARGQWPHDLSHAPIMRVSDVLAAVEPEFPGLSVSKLRYLDVNGLVVPERTASGYRQYSPADVERLRYVLRQQRDKFAPLAVIAEWLDELDSGERVEATALGAVTAQTPLWLSARELAARAGVDRDLVDTLDADGFVAQGIPGKFNRDWVPVVAAAGAYLAGGGDLRTLRGLRNAASREAETARVAWAPVAKRGDAEEAQGAVQEHVERAIAVFSAVARRESSGD